MPFSTRGIQLSGTKIGPGVLRGSTDCDAIWDVLGMQAWDWDLPALGLGFASSSGSTARLLRFGDVHSQSSSMQHRMMLTLFHHNNILCVREVLYQSFVSGGLLWERSIIPNFPTQLCIPSPTRLVTTSAACVNKPHHTLQIPGTE